jgi:hypothetical protein
LISNIEGETLKGKKIMEKTVSCDYCSKELPESSILKHIGNSQACKVHYGPRFDRMKRKKDIIRIKKWRKEKGKEQRELYAQDPEKKEKKKVYYQDKRAKLAKNEKENQLHKQRELYAQDPEKKEKKKLYYQVKRAKLAKNKKEKQLEQQRELYAQDPEKKEKKKLYYQDKQAKLAKKEGWIYYPPSDSEEKDIMKENKVEKKENSKDLDSKEVCEFCKQKFKSTSILIHIGKNQDCKSFYGNRFKELKKEKKKQYYVANQTKLKDYRRKRYAKSLDEKEAYWHAKWEEERPKFVKDWKEQKEKEGRRENNSGMEFCKKHLQTGLKQLRSFGLANETKVIIKNFEGKIDETYNNFKAKIDHAVNSSRDLDEVDKVNEFYDDLFNNNTSTIYDTWHDLRMSINVEFIQTARKFGKKYPGCMACICYKCQIAIGVKNLKKAHANGGYSIPSNSRFEYAMERKK